MKQPEERTDEEKMALLGRPRLGDVSRAQIRIKESKEFKNTVDKLVQRANASIILGEYIYEHRELNSLPERCEDIRNRRFKAEFTPELPRPILVLPRLLPGGSVDDTATDFSF